MVVTILSNSSSHAPNSAAAARFHTLPIEESAKIVRPFVEIWNAVDVVNKPFHASQWDGQSPVPAHEGTSSEVATHVQEPVDDAAIADDVAVDAASDSQDVVAADSVIDTSAIDTAVTVTEVVADESHQLALQAQWDAGYEEGLAKARAEHAIAIKEEHQQLNALMQSINDALSNTPQLFAGFERLALHMAKQLVRGELSLSGDAIRRLIAGCLVDIENKVALTVFLNPEDLDKYRILNEGLPKGASIAPDAALSRGSVRVAMADGAIEDLIEHRLESLAQSLLGSSAEQLGVLGGAQSIAGMSGLGQSSHLAHPVSPSFVSQRHHDQGSVNSHANTVHADVEDLADRADSRFAISDVDDFTVLPPIGSGDDYPSAPAEDSIRHYDGL